MGWDEHTSYNRIHQYATSQRSKPIRISPLKKQLDLGVVLSEFHCRRIYGAHVYASLPAFAQLVSQMDGTAGSNDMQQLIQAIHLSQSEIFRIVEQVFQACQVHFQGPKLHAVVYQPFGRQADIAARAVLLELVLGEFVQRVFHEVFPGYRSITLASGTDLGKTIATRNGRKRNRELLFLGSAANYAAKIVDTHDPFPRLAQELYQVLPKPLQALCEPVKTKASLRIQVYHLFPPNRRALQDLLDRYEIPWKPEESRAILARAKRDCPLAGIQYGLARRRIDVPNLSISNNRRVLAASLFADLSGYTHFIEDAEQTHIQETALRLLHVIRREMSNVVQEDHAGLHIQFQGDRIQGLFHLPRNDERAIARGAVSAAIGLQSSMERTLKACLPEAKPLHLAIGVAIGETLVSRLGVRRHRDAICLGQAVECAAELEEACSAGQIGIARRVYEALPAEMRRCFRAQRNGQRFVATAATVVPQKPARS
ncbi:MAG TPA: adenylate/guanylate cyclase domain-containing protein [Ktedonobacteraceae bacterium]|nr:adenylate/guanylate cyclase domain-containing protein [Ktedonobacteraceae bacterium]